MALIPRRTAVIATFAAALLAAVIVPAGAAFAGGVAAPVLTGPANDTTTPLKDVVLTWDAVAGASQYQVQISPSDEWTNNTVALPNNGATVNNLFEVPMALPHASYFWHVRAEVGGVWSSYSTADQFLRDWDNQITILQPPTTSNPTIVWAPVTDASEYLVRFSTSMDFETGSGTFSCLTNQTSFTPYTQEPSSSCFSEAKLTNGTGYYWQVEPLDDSSATAPTADTANDPSWDCPQVQPECDAGGYRSTTRFTFQAPAADLTSASAGDGTVTGLTTTWHSTSAAGTDCDLTDACPITPTFSWQPVSGANYYEVHVFRDPELTNTYRVYDTAWPEVTPGGSFFDAQAGHAYYWTVQAGTCVNSESDPTCAASASSGSSGSTEATCPTGTGTSGPTLGTSAEDVQATPAGSEGADSVQGGTTATVTLTGTNLNSAVCITASSGSVSNTVWHSSTSVSFTYAAPMGGGSTTFEAVNPDGSTSSASAPLTVDAGTQVNFDAIGGPATFTKASGQVELSSPANNTTVHGRSVTFSWADYLASGTQGTYDARNYELQVSQDSQFDSTVIDDSNIDLTQYTDPTEVLPNGSYYWRVAAIDESGNVLTWSDPRQVTINATAPSIGLTGKKAVSVMGPLTISVSEPISGVSSSTVKVVPVGSSTAVPGTITIGSSNKVYEFRPSSPLVTGESYSLSVSPSLTDSFGNGAVVTSKTVTTSSVAKNTSAGWSFSKAWKRHAASGALSASYMSAKLGHSASVMVVGTTATLYACKGPSMGTITVTTGGHHTKVSEHQSFTRCGVAVWTGALKTGMQKVTVAVTKGASGNVDELAV